VAGLELPATQPHAASFSLTVRVTGERKALPTSWFHQPFRWDYQQTAQPAQLAPPQAERGHIFKNGGNIIDVFTWFLQ